MTIRTSYDIGQTVRYRRGDLSISFMIEQIKIETLGGGLVLVEYRALNPNKTTWISEKELDREMAKGREQ